ncbi:Rha family transcriptional regulator [Herbaspirillum sp. C7C8]|uniref:Rha family transcriptional regulator n=1 Tax=Herbaspirillum sp. C7C8 TaxID=2736665 RepID=UPI001F5208F5|nr:Rha family transcriptional regulator [Herbaspirillum sp. C7C8]MCI1005698.1 Rha family transcriptional regulator [Herbaspirillum sp. C7C8]
MTPKLLAVTPTMTTVEIALLTGKAHKHVMRDTRQMLTELRGEANLSTFEASYTDDRNRTKPAFALPYRETMILVSGYSLQMRAKIIDRWQELEQAAKAPAINLNDPASLRTALLGYTEKVLELKATVAEQAPKVEGFERIADGHGPLAMLAATKLGLLTPYSSPSITKQQTHAPRKILHRQICS